MFTWISNLLSNVSMSAFRASMMLLADNVNSDKLLLLLNDLRVAIIIHDLMSASLSTSQCLQHVWEESPSCRDSACPSLSSTAGHQRARESDHTMIHGALVLAARCSSVLIIIVQVHHFHYNHHILRNDHHDDHP